MKERTFMAIVVACVVAFVVWFIWYDLRHPCTRYEQRFGYDPALKIPRFMTTCVERTP